MRDRRGKATKARAHEAKLSFLKSGPDVGLVSVAWDMAGATVEELHVVLWDFTGMSNAAVLEYMNALELVPAKTQ